MDYYVKVQHSETAKLPCWRLISAKRPQVRMHTVECELCGHLMAAQVAKRDLAYFLYTFHIR